MEHLSVLKEDVQKVLGVKKDEVYADLTLGLGGHTEAILKSVNGDATVLAFDRDKKNLEEAKKRLSKFKNKVVYINDNFCYLKKRVTELGFESVDKILLDLGLSSPHVDDAERGFSFMKEGPLDMRFGEAGAVSGGLRAYEVVNEYPESDLVRIFYRYGEERMAKKIAGKICERRRERPFTTTTELAEFVKESVGGAGRKLKQHPATLIFQAIRIEVNDELEVLKKTLSDAIELLSISGRIAIISYHSLEDRIVKQFFKELESPPAKEEELIYRLKGEPIFISLTRKPIAPTAEEIAKNPRARSAKLRVYEKVREVTQK